MKLVQRRRRWHCLRLGATLKRQVPAGAPLASSEGLLLLSIGVMEVGVDRMVGRCRLRQPPVLERLQ